MIAAAMECSARNELLVNHHLIHTTYPTLFLSVFARQLCLPVPAILILAFWGRIWQRHHYIVKQSASILPGSSATLP